uniref:Uncharacterized protein n=1 Tax=Anguilla anguilla TaxID=7936 RepID=A0A0E9XU53_ANGAN
MLSGFDTTCILFLLSDINFRQFPNETSSLLKLKAFLGSWTGKRVAVFSFTEKTKASGS